MKNLYKNLRPIAAAILETGARAFVVRRAGLPRRAENFKVTANLTAAQASGWVYAGESHDAATY